MRLVRLVGFVVLLAALATGATGLAQTTKQDKNPVPETVIHVEDLDCEACAVVVEYSLEEVAGVAKVKIDVDNQTATVTPKAKESPSPKLMWEAVEKVGFTPVKLVCPSGTFTKKPPA